MDGLLSPEFPEMKTRRPCDSIAGRSLIPTMNPYLPTRSNHESAASPSTRTPRTYLDAAIIGSGMSLIAPVGNATYCDLVLGMPFPTTIREMLTRMIPIAIFCVVCAIGCSFFVPQSLSRVLSHHQNVIPRVAISLLFSLYFGMLGFGFVRGYISIMGYRTSHYVLVPALIAGFGALVHVVVRPKPLTSRKGICGEPASASELVS